MNQLGLKSMPRPKPYPLGWLNKNEELQVQAECTFKFAINEKFKDEVKCDTVPLHNCQVVFGSPCGTVMLLFTEERIFGAYSKMVFVITFVLLRIRGDSL